MMMKIRTFYHFPNAIYFLWVISGPIIILPFVNTKEKMTLVPWVPLAVLPYFMLLFPMNWEYLTLIWGVYNLSTLVYFSKKYPMIKLKYHRVNWQNWLRNFSSLFVFSVPISFLIVGLERWLTDSLLSQYLSVNFSTENILNGYIVGLVQFIVLAFCLSFYLATYKINWNVEKRALVWFSTGVVFIFFNEIKYLLIDIPDEQTLMAGIFSDGFVFARWVIFEYIFIFYITVLIHDLILLHNLSIPNLSYFIRGLICLLVLMLNSALFMGMLPYYSFLTAREFEKYGKTHYAIKWYARTAEWVQSEKFKSYLQYHVGLLARKNGDDEGARMAFENVYLRYDENQELVEKSRKFNKKLFSNRGGNSKRVVIPGVEARTEYKAAYCVPNSLGLVLNYWGDEVGAKSIGKSITNLNEGSFITDEAYYAESRNFNHFVVPLSNLNDIRRLIDKNIPVLAFIPGHVLAIFGYDEALETFITYDVATEEIWEEMSWSEFSHKWNKSFNLLAVVIPKEKKETVETVLGKNIDDVNEKYLQYLFYQLSNESMDKKVEFLQRAKGMELFFANLDYVRHTGKQKELKFTGSVIDNHLFKNGVEHETISVYLFVLLEMENYQVIIDFLKRYSNRNTLSNEMYSILAISYIQSGKERMAEELLLSQSNLLEYEPFILEYLLKNPRIRNSPHLALQISIALLNESANAFLMTDGSSAKLAYSIWKENQSYLSQNHMESLNFIYDYLLNWDPMDQDAIKDLKETFQSMNAQDERMDKMQVWKDRIENLEGNILLPADVI